jgi:hypothetical protein
MYERIEIIPLTARVKVREDKIPELTEKMRAEGVSIPNSDMSPRLGISEFLNMANGPVDTSLEAYQKAQGNYRGRVMHAQDREQAIFVRRQFAEFLEEDSGT